MSGPLFVNRRSMDSPSVDKHTGLVKAEAFRLGFDACGVACASTPDPDNHLGEWLRRGYHAEMEWMARTEGIRRDVSRKVPGAKSVLVVTRNYYTGDMECPADCGKVARYAWGEDYHSVLLPRLNQLADFLKTLQPGGIHYAEVDTGPVLERAWAARAGLGWIGKNGLLVCRKGGSWFFLGVLITTLELVPDTPVRDYCGECRACMDACPVQAIVEPRMVDARRCIAYHTIENRGEILESVQASMGAWVFGCDACQEVCPWNRFARITSERAFFPHSWSPHPSLEDVLKMEESEFKERFARSPILRAKHAGLRRNARIALKNSMPLMDT